jgi:beta-glucanase (GH16 family)
MLNRKVGAAKLANRTAFLVIPLVWLLSASGAVAQTWKVVWADEFARPQGTPIDAAKWKFDTGVLKVNNEVEYYCAPGMTAGGCNPTKPNAYIDGSGHLVIQAIKLNANTAPDSGSWTSARLLTNGTEQFQYGRAEAKMMLPVGPGIWPAFWALGSDISSAGWPNCGEIDYMENVPASAGLGPTKISSTLHGGGYSGEHGLSQKYTLPSGDVTGWHTYGAIWSPYMIQFYVDDPEKVFAVRTASDIPAGHSWAFNHPFFLLLNLAVGGVGSWPGPVDATTPSPAIMTVDYVRIYQASAISAPTLANAAPISVKAGATTGNTSILSAGNAVGTGRVFLSCTTNALNATCQVDTNDPLNSHTLDFTKRATGTAKVTVSTSGGATPAGKYAVTVNAYTVSGNGTAPDAAASIPLTVN